MSRGGRSGSKTRLPSTGRHSKTAGVSQAAPAPSRGSEATGNGLVKIAYLHTHQVSHSWHQSLLTLAMYDATHHGRVVEAGPPLAVRCDSGGLVAGRNLAVQHFLDQTPHEWLFFIDTDMGFEPNIVDRLVEAADPTERPVVGALCFSAREVRPDGMGGYRIVPTPTLFNIAKTEDGQVGFAIRYDVPDNTLVQVAATGAAALLIHRSALVTLRDKYGDHWFDQVKYASGELLSEDLSFCYRLCAAAIPIFVHTGVPTTHHKSIWIGPEDYAMGGDDE